MNATDGCIDELKDETFDPLCDEHAPDCGCPDCCGSEFAPGSEMCDWCGHYDSCLALHLLVEGP